MSPRMIKPGDEKECTHQNTCDLDHCENGFHHFGTMFGQCRSCLAAGFYAGRCAVCNEKHDPAKISCEELARIRAAERRAGWDPNP